MKRALGLIIVSVLLFLTSCNYSNETNTTTVKSGTYILEHTGIETFLYPQVIIFDENISFTYDPLSSYLPVGVFTIEGNILTMVTNDKLYKYAFLIDGDKLIFQKNGSSKVKLTDDKIGTKVTDNAEFKLKEINVN